MSDFKSLKKNNLIFKEMHKNMIENVFIYHERKQKHEFEVEKRMFFEWKCLKERQLLKILFMGKLQFKIMWLMIKF